MLPKTADYALRVVVCLARERSSSARASELAQETQVPRRYLNKVLRDLVTADLIGSRPGPGGGYLLTRDAAEVTILDVVNAVGSLERIRHCPLGLPAHTRLCPLHRELDNVYAATKQAFSRVSIDQLLESEAPGISLCDFTIEHSGLC